MKLHLHTDRLDIRPLSAQDAAFIFELLNTEEWKAFIGNRNINTMADAEAYIQRIVNNTTLQYWVAVLKEDGSTVGAVTFIKRDYLEHPDIGFAFLPRYFKKGYALEATKAVLDSIKDSGEQTKMLGVTMQANTTSIQLLERLGLSYQHDIDMDGETLRLHAIDMTDSE